MNSKTGQLYRVNFANKIRFKNMLSGELTRTYITHCTTDDEFRIFFSYSAMKLCMQKTEEKKTLIFYTIYDAIFL